MSFQYRQAKRQNVPLLIGLAGASGSGKTLSALLLAKGLANGQPFYGLDTENGRMLHYADDFDFLHGSLEPPFRPERYTEAIEIADASQAPVIVVDSFSHEHAGEGGLLDWHEQELDRMAGDDWKKRDALTFAAWVKPKAAHQRMMNKLLAVRAHVIVCLRAADRVEIIKVDGKTKVVPKRTVAGYEGWVPVCEKNLPFELTASFVLTPDAPGVPKPIKLNAHHRPFFPLDRPITEDAGALLCEWASGAGAAAVAPAHSQNAGLSMSALLAWIAESDADKDKLAEIARELFPGGTGFKSLTDQQRAAVKAAYEELVHA